MLNVFQAGTLDQIVKLVSSIGSSVTALGMSVCYFQVRDARKRIERIENYILGGEHHHNAKAGK